MENYCSCRTARSRPRLVPILIASLSWLAVSAQAQPSQEDTPPAQQAAPEAAPPEDSLPDSDGDGQPDSPEGEALQGTEEVIIITGSRIRTDPLDKPAPVLELTGEEIARSGLTSVGDLLQKLPVSGGAINSRFNSSGNFGFPPDGGGVGAGATEADMRYLGSKRVLVLVDGVRWVNGSSGSGVPSATDLNTIPIGIIERIEVLEDGASPIYGSDAIGGVINIITKKNWEGTQANVYTGAYHQGDGLTQNYDVTWGSKNEKMSIIVSVSYADQKRVSSADRALSAYPIPNIGRCTGRCSSGTPQGRFVLVDPNTGQELNLTINNGVDGVPVYDPMNPTGGDFHEFTTADRFNYAPYNLVLTPLQRVGVFSGVEYKLHPRLKLHARALFNNRTSTNQAAPEPLAFGPGSGSTGRMSRIVIHETNPYNPFGFTIDPATNPYFFARRPLEAGPRIFNQTVNTFYLTGGVQGDFVVGGRRVFWDATSVYAVNRADQIKSGGFNTAKLEKALGPVDVCRADAQCVPFNLFGGQGVDGLGTITPEMLDYVTFVQQDVSEQELVDLTANVSTDLAILPGGALSLAAGIEHRRQSGFFQPDAVVVAGDGADVPASPTAGEFNATEGYLELRVPIIANRPGFSLFDVSGAVRVSDYSTFGSEATFKAGARWRPGADFLFRGSYGQGFRAPGIGELFGSDARFDQMIDDPCSDMRGLEGGTVATPEIIANCIALGVPEDGSYSQFNSQIAVTTGGNRQLAPETADSISVSLAYSPSWLEASSWVDSLDIELGYYRLELDRAIQAIDAQVQLDRCVRTLDPVLCQGISRTEFGVINGFANQLTNIGGLTTDGIDLAVTYATPMTGAGRYRATWLSSVLLQLTERIPSAEGFDEIKREGTEVGDPERAFPRLKSTLVLDWFVGEWRTSLTTRYIHSVREACRNLQDFPGLCSDPDPVDDTKSENVLSPTIYNDLQLTYTPRHFDNLMDVTVGVNNLFNREPPACYSCPLNGFDASTYDVPGVFAYLKAGYRM